MQAEAAPEIDSELLSQKIQTGCGLNKKAADLLSAIFLGLYSRENEESWAEKNLEGFKRFLEDYLDGEFEDYCTEDDYYQPVCEDFDIDYYVSQWCKEYGFDLVSRNGGGDGGYEPKYRKGWY